jgi:hypothetical protein
MVMVILTAMTEVNILIVRKNCPAVGGHHSAFEGLGFCYTEFEGTPRRQLFTLFEMSVSLWSFFNLY